MKVDALLLDIDGVLVVGDQTVPGAPEAIRWLIDQGIPYRYISNSTQRSRKEIAERLRKAGVTISIDQLQTPVVAALSLLEEEGITTCRLLMTESARSEFLDAGITDTGEGVDAVIIGDAGEGFTYQVLNAAFREIHDGALPIALERDRYWMAADGLSLAAGPFVAALEYATGKTARILGKPSPDAFRAACSQMGSSPGSTAMIGDDIRSDVGGAQDAGLLGVLVQTGKYTDRVLEESGIQPDMILPSIADLRALFV
ncbi:MAG: TIGR01458 family HAD-type hydrolase [Methanocalculus sp. MSAO_Arc1]|uniref:TIGR01458 family HAD-type hydrolase n=1 Tax=Methanocalculus TaxID=71151 RepID=UPI000FF35F19|nr:MULTISPECIES: TIGR01458 family HAD-type hydrolase [unclassified Methanocalculus]MCP1662654.1 HAD superfamily hydrolase (TIGR01458 family) [Methanocalculus sp. AMF5]RQD80315.1 MAG: TIGR01458 family HAD-type hydrolase [Methanocalculus sp. MSAO_Arc1]